MTELSRFVDSRREAALGELMELLRIPSISTDPLRGDDMARCAALVAARLEEAGLRAQVVPTGGHPAVYGERLPSPGKPTVLVYGHYDVQPPDPVQLWRHGPFEPTVEGESIVARGATDDKGQFYALIKGIEASFRTRGELPVNVKVLIEGEEEIGSPHLLPFVRAEGARLACDVVVIADSSQFAREMPAITYGLRGLVYLEIIVRGPNSDLHSGSFGGAVANPAGALARMIAACQGPFGKVAIPGFYDGVRDLEPWEREAFARLPFDEEAFRRQIGGPRLHGEEGYTTLERRWARPTFDVNGLWAGFTAVGAKTVLPSEARAKLSMRLVPDQDPERISALAADFLRQMAPGAVEVEVLELHAARPVLLSREGKEVLAARRACLQGFGREPVFVRGGGSIPAVSTFHEELKVQSLLLGLGLPDDGAHAPNEKFRLEDFYRGMVTMGTFLEELDRA